MAVFSSGRDVASKLNAAMGVDDSVCVLESGQTLTLQFTYKCALFTVAAVSRSSVKDDEALNALGARLLAEADLMLAANTQRSVYIEDVTELGKLGEGENRVVARLDNGRR